MNLTLIVVAIGLFGLLHLAVGVYGSIRLARAFSSTPDWRQTLWLSGLTALFFSLAIALWIAMLFILPRTSAPAAVLNVPAWILFGGYVAVEVILRQTKSSKVIAWEGVALAVPACSLFAYVYYEPLKQIFGPIRTW